MIRLRSPIVVRVGGDAVESGSIVADVIVVVLGMIALVWAHDGIFG